MKRFVVFALAVLMMLGCMVACGETDIHKKSEGTMTYAEYMAADMEAEVTIEAFVQAAQGWWEKNGQGVITVYLQDKDGAYFAYEMKCSEEDSKKLTAGTKIKVTGYKGAFEGEVEVMDATFEILEGSWVAEAADLTALLGKDEMIDHQNEKALFKGMTVVSWAYQNETQGMDIYLTVSKDDAQYDFCVESYLTGSDTEVYKAVEALKEGDVIDIEGFVYWYKGMNPHVTAVTKK